MIIYLFPLFIGIAAIVQGGMNKQISATWGLSPTVLLNAWVFLIASAFLYYGSRYFPGALPDFLKSKNGEGFSWWYVLPGLAGLVIVVGTPYAIEKIGAFKVFVALIGTQLLGSLVWDAMIEKIPVTTFRIFGAIFSFGCALFVAMNA